MRLRRCAILFMTSNERLDFNLSALTVGGTGVDSVIEWIALAPHLDAQLVITLDEIAVLGAVSPLIWSGLDHLARAYPREVLDGLLTSGLLLLENADSLPNRRDEALREMHWRGLDAIAHRYSRWHDVNTVEAQQIFAEETGQGFLERLGTCPPPVHEHGPPGTRIPLSRPQASPLDEVLARRVTCRNYDTSRLLHSVDFGAVLFRAFGASAVHEYAPGVTLLKKSSPSAGGLHPVGAYILVRQVEGVKAGLYHYHPVAHALEPLVAMSEFEVAALAVRFLGGQTYFADAHVTIALVARFRRNYWKYRNHAKAYRSVVLDSGHLSQTLYLAATELGLGAFITAGVNELDVEQVLDLDPMEEGIVAACGFGVRSSECNEEEFDPLNAVWPSA